MGTLLTLRTDEWTKLEASDGSAILSTSEKKAVTHTTGANSAPIVLKQLSADPAHPFTAGQLQITFDTAVVRGGHTVDIAHTDGYPREDFFIDHFSVGEHTIHQGGLYLTDYRVPLEWAAQIRTQLVPQKYFLQFNVFKPDFTEIDEDEQTDATITIDPNVDGTATDIALANGTSSPGGDRGGIEIQWELTAAQHTALTPVDGNGARVNRKVGLTIAATSSVAPVTYSTYNETHAGVNEGEYYLRHLQTIGLQAPATGAWYARATRTDGKCELHVGD